MRIASITILLAALALAAGPAHSQSLYWVDTFFNGPGLYKADADGNVSAAEPLVAATLPEGLAVDASGKLYWAEAAWSNAKINRAASTLQSITPLVSGGSVFRGVAVDNVNHYLFWTSSNLVTGARVHRSTLNGAGAVPLITLAAGANPRGIAVDPGAGKIYWTDFDLSGIYSANLDGTGAAQLVSLAANCGAYGLAVDPDGQFLYWTEYNTGFLRRCTTGGAGVTTLMTELANPTYLALDLAGGRMFWTEGGVGNQRIRRAFTNGTAVVTLLGLSTYGGVAYLSNGAVSTPGVELPAEFALERVWPSPSRGPIHVAFSLPRSTHVRVSVLDIQGREVGVLADGVMPAGRHERQWNSRGRGGAMPPGIYIVRMAANGRHWVKRLALTR